MMKSKAGVSYQAACASWTKLGASLGSASDRHRAEAGWNTIECVAPLASRSRRREQLGSHVTPDRRVARAAAGQRHLLDRGSVQPGCPLHAGTHPGIPRGRPWPRRVPAQDGRRKRRKAGSHPQRCAGAAGAGRVFPPCRGSHLARSVSPGLRRGRGGSVQEHPADRVRTRPVGWRRAHHEPAVQGLRHHRRCCPVAAGGLGLGWL